MKSGGCMFLLFVFYPVLSQIDINNLPGKIIHFLGDSVVYDLATNKVIMWKNLADGGNNAFPDNPSWAPTYVPNYINGKGALLFDGQDDYLRFNRVYGKTFFIVLKETYVSGGYIGVLFGDDTYADFHRGGSNGEYLSSTYAHPALLGNKKSMVGGVYIRVDDGSGGIIPKVDSVYVVGLRTSLSDSATTNLIAPDRLISGRYLKGYIMEVLIFKDYLPDSTFFLVSLYLLNKYGLTQSCNSLSYDTIYSYLPDTLTLNQNLIASKYTWSTGDTGISVIIPEYATYYSAGYILHSKTCVDTVVFAPFPFVPDTVICPPDTVKVWGIPLDMATYSFVWSNGETQNTVTAHPGNEISVTITRKDGTVLYKSRRFRFILDSVASAIDLGPDREMCLGDTIFFPAGASYLWENGSTSNFYEITGSGKIQVTAVTSAGCSLIDSVNITAVVPPSIEVYYPYSCEGTTNQWTFSVTATGQTITSVEWYFGDGTSSTAFYPYKKYDSGGYFYPVMIAYSDIGCRVVTKDTIYVSPLPHTAIDLPSWICNNGTQFLFLYNGLLPSDSIISFQWKFSDGMTFATDTVLRTFSGTGKYVITLTAQSQSGCMDSGVVAFMVYDSMACVDVSALSGAWLWVSSDTLLQVNNGYVSQWVNRLTGGTSLTQSNPSFSPQFINAIDVINGKPAVKFDGIDDYLGFFPNQNIRTVFWVIRENPAITNLAPLLGHSSLSDFHRGWNKVLFSDVYASPGIKQGIVRQNHIKVNPVLTQISNNWAIISLVSTQNLSGDHFGSDRFIGDRFFNGELAELVVLNAPLDTHTVKKVESYLHYKYAPPVNLGPDIYVKYGFCPVVLDASSRYVSYIWSTGNTSPSITVNKSGIYSVTVTDVFGWQWSDSVRVTFPGNLNPPSTAICAGDSMVWDTGLPTSSYYFQWSNGSTVPSITITSAGTYSLTITDTNGCYVEIKNVVITVDSFSLQYPRMPDTFVCVGGSFCLSDTLNAIYFSWSNGQSLQCITFSSPGIYQVTVKNINNCVVMDTFDMGVKGYAPIVNFAYKGNCYPGTIELNGYTQAQSGYSIDTAYFIINGDTIGGDTISFGVSSPQPIPVKFVAVDNNGCFNVYSDTLQVGQPPTASFFSPFLICSDKTYQFNSSSLQGSVPLNEWKWIFYNTSTQTADTVYGFWASYYFAFPDTYQLTHIVTDVNGCVDDTVVNVIVKPTSQAYFTFSGHCSGYPVEFYSTSTGVQYYQWWFGDGTPMQWGGPSKSHIYIPGGTYDVTLRVTNYYGCADDTTITVTVYNSPEISISAITPVCNNSPGQFIAGITSTDTLEYIKWYVDGLPVDSSLSVVLAYQLPAGPHAMSTVVKTTKECYDTAYLSFFVYDSPDASFEVNPSYGSPPLNVSMKNTSTGATQYFWDFGDGATSSIASPTHIYSDTGIYPVVLRAVNAYGCSDIATFQITVDYPFYDLSLDNITVGTSGEILLQITNKSNLPVSYFEITYYSREEAVSEKINYYMEPGKSYPIQPNIRLVLKDNTEYVCARIYRINGFDDIHPEDNYSCTSIKGGFFLISYNWNKSQKELTLDILSDEDQQITLILYSINGKILFTQPVRIEKGFNSIEIRDLHISAGINLLYVPEKEKVFKLPLIEG